MVFMFWFLAFLAFMTIAGYGLIMIALSRLVSRLAPSSADPLTATLLIAAHNEEHCIGEKVRNALSQDVGRHRLSIVVASDGSTDRTVERVREIDDPRVTMVEVTQQGGKVAAMLQALTKIESDVVIFSDANSCFVPGALAALLRHFGNPRVGGVCGALAIDKSRSGWLGRAEDLYWGYDNALKIAESRLTGAVSAQGSLYAMRRHLLSDIPKSVADDFYISTAAVAAGKRLVFEPAALTIETVSNNTSGEFGRRVRSTERGWRGLLMRRRLLNPFRTGGYAIALFFHKVLRRMVPLMLLAAFVLSIMLAPQHPVYALALVAQVAAYATAAACAVWPSARRLPGASFLFFFVETQVAMALGLSRVVLRMHSRSWKPVRDVPVGSAE